MSTKPKLIYPYSWGRNIVNTFVEKYPRGTWNLAKLTAISPGEVRHQLIILVCTGNELKFGAMKRVIKCLCDYAPEDLKRLSFLSRAVLHKYLVLMGEDSEFYSRIDNTVIDDWQQRRLIL